MPQDFLARKISSAERGARIAGDRLDEYVVESAAGFQGPYQKNIQEHTAGQAQGVRSGLFLKIGSKLKNQLLEIVLRAARQVGAYHGIWRGRARRYPEFTINLRGKNAARVRPGRKVTAVQRRHATGFPGKQFTENGKIFGLA